MIHNGVSACPNSQEWGDEWRAFDRLPRVVRHALHESTVQWDARIVAKEMRFARKEWSDVSNSKLLKHVVNWIKECDVKEVEMSQGLWPSRFGPYPAIAAQSTIMRYDEASLHRGKRKVIR